MILAIANDSTVTALESVAQANTYCEGIDVEEGVYTFIDEHGVVLSPRFTVPNRRGRLLGLLPWVSSGFFTLDRTAEQRLDLLADVIAQRILTSPGPTPFSTQESLSKYLQDCASKSNDQHDR